MARKSEVWNFFKLEETNGEKRTRCDICNTTLSFKSNSTKTMWNHIRSKHGHSVTEDGETVQHKYRKRQLQITDFAGPKTKFSREKQEICYKRAAEVCASDLRPFSMFGTPAYRRYMAIVQPAYTPPVANTVKKYLHLQYVEEKKKMIEELKDQVAVGTTSDIWTSTATHGYITETGHYITKDWEIKHCVLATSYR